jgi:hypothetical protein
MEDLGFEEGEGGEVTLTVSLDDDTEQAENEQQEGTISSHKFSTCPEELAKRALFLRVGMRVRGCYTVGRPVTGEIVGGNWPYVTVRDDTMQEHPSVPVNSLKILSVGEDQQQKENGEKTKRKSGLGAKEDAVPIQTAKSPEVSCSIRNLASMGPRQGRLLVGWTEV